MTPCPFNDGSINNIHACKVGEVKKTKYYYPEKGVYIVTRYYCPEIERMVSASECKTIRAALRTEQEKRRREKLAAATGRSVSEIIEEEKMIEEVMQEMHEANESFFATYPHLLDEWR